MKKKPLNFGSESPDNFFEKSGNMIDLKRTQELYNNYNNNLKDAIEARQEELVERDGYKETEYIVLSIQQLEHYLDFLKKVENANSEQDNHEISGIAIFLGAYNKTDSLKDIPRFNPNVENEDQLNQENDRITGDIRQRITVFLSPTYRDANENTPSGNPYRNEFQRQVPFYIQANNPENKYQGQYVNLVKYLRENADKQPEAEAPSTTSRSFTINTSLNANEFHSAPPPLPD